MVAKKSDKSKKIWLLIVALIGVVFGGVLFVGAVSGWFSGPEMATIDAEYYCYDKCELELEVITPDEYEEMIQSGKSFVVFIDEGGCVTANKMRDFAESFSNVNRFTIFKLFFEDLKEISLGEYVKYYPSVAVISRGRVIAWLRADSDEDAPAYNNFADFEEWMKKYIKL